MNALELKHVYKRYGDFEIRDLNLALPRGCVMGLVGENGAGKSTTIRMLLGIVPPDSGEIEVLGNSPKSDFNHVKEDIGVVLDEPGFPEMLTAKQVGAIMRKTYKNWDSAAFQGYLKTFDLPEKKQFKAFSRGMKMKLSIATALSHHAKLLLLDEATSGLDPVVRDEILDIFFEFTRDENCSILLSSHIVSDLEKLCDYVAFLHKGKLLICQEKDELMERFGLIHLTKEQAKDLDGIILGKKETPYGVDALVEKTDCPGAFTLGAMGLEDLFVYLTKGDA